MPLIRRGNANLQMHTYCVARYQPAVRLTSYLQPNRATNAANPHVVVTARTRFVAQKADFPVRTLSAPAKYRHAHWPRAYGFSR